MNKLIEVHKNVEGARLPYCVVIEFSGLGNPTVTQEVSEEDLLKLFNSLIREYGPSIKVEINMDEMIS